LHSDYNNSGSSWPAGRFPKGGHPCTATISPTLSGASSHPTSPTATTTAGPATRGRNTAPLVNGILWHLHTGAPWPDPPDRYGPWQTVYDRFNRWRKDGTWANVLDALLLRLDKAGLIDRELWCVDASVIRASRAAAGAEKKSGPVAPAGRVEADANAGAG
jgi:transposase